MSAFRLALRVQASGPLWRLDYRMGRPRPWNPWRTWGFYTTEIEALAQMKYASTSAAGRPKEGKR